jgi:hypothetical protein
MNNPNKRKKKRSGRDTIYEEALKIAVAREYFKGELGYVKLGHKYKLSGSTVRDFVTWYKATFDVVSPAGNEAQPATDPPLASQPIAADIALQKQLDDALLKIAALETMIAIADKELGTSILKKPGAKQSRP